MQPRCRLPTHGYRDGLLVDEDGRKGLGEVVCLAGLCLGGLHCQGSCESIHARHRRPSVCLAGLADLGCLRLQESMLPSRQHPSRNLGGCAAALGGGHGVLRRALRDGGPSEQGQDQGCRSSGGVLFFRPGTLHRSAEQQWSELTYGPREAEVCSRRCNMFVCPPLSHTRLRRRKY